MPHQAASVHWLCCWLECIINNNNHCHLGGHIVAADGKWRRRWRQRRERERAVGNNRKRSNSMVNPSISVRRVLSAHSFRSLVCFWILFYSVLATDCIFTCATYFHIIFCFLFFSLCRVPGLPKPRIDCCWTLNKCSSAEQFPISEMVDANASPTGTDEARSCSLLSLLFWTKPNRWRALTSEKMNDLNF